MPKPTKRNVKWYQPEAPTFAKLPEEGSAVEGIFLGVTQTGYGPGYRFRGANGVFILGGNRAALDRAFQELLTDPKSGYGAGGPVGHYLVVERIADVESKAGRTVGQYRIGHDFDHCPKGCTPF
jgi:hypothetical protein